MSESQMPEPFDVNKLAAEVFIAATERAVRSVAIPVQTTLRRILHGLADAYSPYVQHTFQRVKSIRTFLKPNEPVDLLDSYVSALLSDGKQNVYPEVLLQELKDNDRIIISGLAGRGKSVLMRYLAVSLYHTPKGKIPIFIELRSLNSLTSPDILQYIHAQYKGVSNIQYSDFLEALHKGYFIFLFDGFDEINPELRSDIEKEIIDISAIYQKCPLIITGRPDDRFSSWEQFKMYHVCPMSYE